MTDNFDKIGCVGDDSGFQREAFDIAGQAMERFCFRGNDFESRLRQAFAHIYLKGAQSGFDTCRALNRKTNNNN